MGQRIQYLLLLRAQLAEEAAEPVGGAQSFGGGGDGEPHDQNNGGGKEEQTAAGEGTLFLCVDFLHGQFPDAVGGGDVNGLDVDAVFLQTVQKVRDVEFHKMRLLSQVSRSVRICFRVCLPRRSLVFTVDRFMPISAAICSCVWK